jgi:predicted nucleic acid-binding protein
MMGYPAHNELSTIQREVELLSSSGRLEIHEVVWKSPAGVLFKALRRSGIHKGEAEAIAWAVENHDRATRPIFVSVDRGARECAGANKVIAVDMMGAIVEWCEEGILDRELVRKATEVWEDRAQERGRPSDYAGFDHTYAQRLSVRKND